MNPITEGRERVIERRAKVNKVSKKSNASPKRIAAVKIKAARLQEQKATRAAKKQAAIDKAAAEERQKRHEVEAAERTAFVAAKEAEAPQKVTFVERVDQVRALIDEVMALSNPALYLDAEGISLSRSGEMVFLQMYIDTDTGPHTYVIDTWALGTDNAFHKTGFENASKTFKDLLEDPAIPKLFWDCRMDSEALYHQHGISLAGVLDVQLLEVAKRPVGSDLFYLQGYGRAVARDAGLDWYDEMKMQRAKGAKSLFIPDLGGSWSVLKARPLLLAMLDYCSGDVLYMRRLFEQYSKDLLVKDQRITPDPTGMLGLDHPADFFASHWYKWAGKVVAESAERVRRSQEEGWDRTKERMNKSPWWDEPRANYYPWEDEYY